MPTLDWEGQAHQMFGICLVWVHKEDSPHKHYILGQWATHSWYYHTDSPVPQLPEWGGGCIIKIMAFYLFFLHCISVWQSQSGCFFFYWWGPIPLRNPVRSPHATEGMFFSGSLEPWSLTSVGAIATITLGVFNTPGGV